MLERELLRQEGGAPLEAECRHGDLPTFPHGPEHVLLRGARLVEEHFVELGAARQLAQRSHVDARLVHRAQEVGEPVVRRRLGVGTAHDEAPVGAVRQRGPHLLTGDHPLVAVEHGAGLDVGEIRAGVRLGEPLAPQLVDRLDLREEPALLLVGAELDEGRGEEALAEERDPRGSVRPRVLLVEDHLQRERKRPPAVLHGPGRAHPAIRAEHVLPLEADIPPRLVGRAATRAERRELAGEVLGQPRAHLGAKGRLFSGVAEVHAGSDAT